MNTTTQATSARRDFSRATLRALAARGIEVIGAGAAPAYEGDVYFSGVSYQLVQDGCLYMRSFAEVKAIAAGAVLGEVVEEAA